MEIAASERSDLIRRGQRLEYVTIAYNSLEALIALVSGFLASSIALVGFGFDSVIEVTSGAAVCAAPAIAVKKKTAATAICKNLFIGSKPRFPFQPKDTT